MEPEEFERIEALLSAVALRHLRAVLEEREDVVVSLVAPDLRCLWASERGTGTVYGAQPGDDGGIDIRSFIAHKDLARFEAAVALALSGESVEFLGTARKADGRELLVRAVMWPTDDRTAVVAVTSIEGDAPGEPDPDDRAATVSDDDASRHR